jgi:Zn-dependent peptidase ImmA (M78 family)
MNLTYIRALAEEYATKYNPENVAPFPYANVIKDKNDLEIYFVDLEDPEVAGVTLFKDGIFNILINNDKPETRQNLTLGHGLGHYFLHQKLLKEKQGVIDSDEMLDDPKVLYRVDGENDLLMEVEANNFAASLIMPADLVRRAWDATRSIEDCARIFKVSPVAMSIRLTKLGLVSE